MKRAIYPWRSRIMGIKPLHEKTISDLDFDVDGETCVDGVIHLGISEKNLKLWIIAIVKAPYNQCGISHDKEQPLECPFCAIRAFLIDKFEIKESDLKEREL
jgi:hypothetical protein